MTEETKTTTDESSSLPKAVERITLGKDEAEKVAAWLRQLETSSSGFLNLTRADVVNFLIRNHKEALSPKELQQIRVQNYDPVRHLNWITPRLKAALQANDNEAVAALQKEIRQIEIAAISKMMPTVSHKSEDIIRKKKTRAPKPESPTAEQVNSSRETTPENP